MAGQTRDIVSLEALCGKFADRTKFWTSSGREGVGDRDGDVGGLEKGVDAELYVVEVVGRTQR